jgi:hypothetical protein
MICMVQRSGQIGHELDVQRTRRPRDASSKNAASKRRVAAQGTHCSRDVTSEGFRLVTHPSGTLYHVFLQMIGKNHYVKNFSTACLPKNPSKKFVYQNAVLLQ